VSAKPIHCELTVIGSGLAGMAAALFASGRGLSTAIVGGCSEIIFASGYLDLLGVHPIADGRIQLDPWAGIAALTRDHPGHPFARLSPAEIHSAVEELIGALEEGGLSYDRRLNQNVMALSPMGTVKPTYGVPASMWPGVAALEEKPRCVILGLEHLKGFSSRLIAETLKPSWPDVRSAQMSFPESGRPGELYAERVAFELELAGRREQFARCVHPHVKNAQVVGLPAILGLYHAADAYADLTQRIGVPLFEIPTMPPSVAGLRLKAVFEKILAGMGVRTFFGRHVLNARRTSPRGFSLEIGNSTESRRVRSAAVILATGRFLGGGLHAERKRIRETVFDLPVYQPRQRPYWHRRAFLDPRGHRINRFGLETDEHFRPLDAGGKPADEALFAAGAILAHQDWVRQKCGSGLAVASAYGAVSAYLGLGG
jgi:glycerol-3-phosphate dehydrogenase subunit B